MDVPAGRGDANAQVGRGVRKSYDVYSRDVYSRCEVERVFKVLRLAQLDAINAPTRGRHAI